MQHWASEKSKEGVTYSTWRRVKGVLGRHSFKAGVLVKRETHIYTQREVLALKSETLRVVSYRDTRDHHD